jgi:glutamate formiminotransferase
MALVECIPNFSEGRDSRVITSIRDAIAGAGGIVLDVSSDSSHNRSVITFVAQLGDAVEAAFAAMSTARELIDLTKHKG